MTIEKLTEDMREAAAREESEYGLKCIRIISAQAAEIKRLRADLADEYRPTEAYSHRVAAAAELVFSRTEAEQAVLDAMARIPHGHLSIIVVDGCPAAVDACRAELARRRLK